MSQEFPNLEEIQINRPYHGMQDISFLHDPEDVYLKWYSEDNTALGFQFCQGDLKDSFVYILRDSIVIDDGKVSFKHEVIRNPHNKPKETFESKEFYDVLTLAINDVVDEFLEWKRETHGA